MKKHVKIKARAGEIISRLDNRGPDSAKGYRIYNREDLELDLCQAKTASAESEKKIYLDKEPETVTKGDVIISLQNLRAAMVTEPRNGFMLTNNFALLIPSENLDPGYLVYRVNEDFRLHQAFMKKLPPGFSILPKIKLSDLLEVLNEMKIPSMETQKRVAETYFAIKKRKYLEIQRAEDQERYDLELLKGASND